MDQQKRLTLSTLRIAGLAIVALFLVPALTFALSGEILRQWDQGFADAISQKAAMEGRTGIEAFIERTKPSVICHATEPELAEARHTMCPAFSSHLNIPEGYVRDWENGKRRPTGTALKLLSIIRAKGLDVLS